MQYPAFARKPVATATVKIANGASPADAPRRTASAAIGSPNAKLKFNIDESTPETTHTTRQPGGASSGYCSR